MDETDEFSSPEKQFYPLNVNNPEVDDISYFGSNSKWLKTFLAILPYPILLVVFLKAQAPIGLILLITFGYLILLYYFLRFVIFEERRLRKQLNEMDENQLSDTSYFYSIEDIGTTGENDGRILYQKLGGGQIIQGYVIGYDKGSMVNVPSGYVENYRRTKEHFLQKIAQVNYNFHWYEIARIPHVSQGLMRYVHMLEGENNDVARMTLSLNVTMDILATLNSSQRYLDYIIVTNSTFDQLQNFRDSLDNLVSSTLGASNFLVNPHILGHDEVEDFFTNYYMQDTMNTAEVRKSAHYVPVEKFVKLTTIYDKNMHKVPLMLYNRLNANEASRGKDIAEVVSKQQQQDDRKEVQRQADLNRALATIQEQRNTGVISIDEYEDKADVIKDRYSRENYDPNREAAEKQQRLQEQREARLAERTARRSAGRQQRSTKGGQVPSQAPKQWYDDESGQQTQAVITEGGNIATPQRSVASKETNNQLNLNDDRGLNEIVASLKKQRTLEQDIATKEPGIRSVEPKSNLTTSSSVDLRDIFESGASTPEDSTTTDKSKNGSDITLADLLKQANDKAGKKND